MFNLIRWLAFRKKNKKFLNAAETLRKGSSMADVRQILGTPSKETSADFGRVMWLFYRGIFHSISPHEAPFNGSPFCLTVEFINGNYESHRLTFFQKDDPLVKEWVQMSHPKY